MNNVARSRILGLQLFTLEARSTSSWTVLAFIISSERSDIMLIGLPFKVTWLFSLVVLSILSLVWILHRRGSFLVMLGVLYVSWFWMTSSPRLEGFCCNFIECVLRGLFAVPWYFCPAWSSMLAPGSIWYAVHWVRFYHPSVRLWKQKKQQYQGSLCCPRLRNRHLSVQLCPALWQSSYGPGARVSKPSP